MKDTHLLLASQSPRRRELLQLLGLPFDVHGADIPETLRPAEPPAEAVARLSRAKAEAVTGYRDGPRVAADTVVAQGQHILGKPNDAAEATAMLRRLRRAPHAVFTGLTLLDPGTGRVQTEVARTAVEMRPYTEAEIAAYVASGDPFDKAGAYAIQNAAFRPVARIAGCYANVVGLPLCHLTRGLRYWDIEPLYDVPEACQRHTGRRCAVYPAILAGQVERSSL